jgi:uncharacterized protein (TIGR02757 family)
MITKNELDILVDKYETVDFIKDDPIQFPHQYKSKEDIALVGFISSLFAYGNRKMFIKKLAEIFGYMENKPCDFIKSGDFSIIQSKGVNYRFSKPCDIVELFNILSKLYNSSSGLSELFEYGYKVENSIHSIFYTVCDYFYSNVQSDVGQGFYHLLPNPRLGGAMKRMCMYLRWLVRKSDVDLGIWDFMPKSDLLIPLDVHVSRLSREMNLLTRKSNDMKSVIEITENLKRFDPDDPVKYDFAIFGKGVEK